MKHRLGKNHKMRIVVFVGSPVEANEKEVSQLFIHYFESFSSTRMGFSRIYPYIRVATVLKIREKSGKVKKG